MVTHDKACKLIKNDPILQMVVYRKDAPPSLHQQPPTYLYDGYVLPGGAGNSHTFQPLPAAPNTSFMSPDKYWVHVETYNDIWLSSPVNDVVASTLFPIETVAMQYF